jgi:hypothetical protein
LIEEYLGKDVLDQFRMMPIRIFKHLPDPHKQIIAKIITGVITSDNLPEEDDYDSVVNREISSNDIQDDVK